MFRLLYLFCFLIGMTGANGQTTWRTHAHVVSGFVEYSSQKDECIQIYNLAIDSVIVLEKNFPFHVESTTATLSDQEGNLRAFSNGCSIFRGDLSPMPGGAIINPGNVHDMSCPTAGYIAEQGAFFIDKPGAPGRFLLIHAGLDHLNDNYLHVGRIAWSEVDFSTDASGVVAQSNVVIAEGDLEPATATRHGNGRDWWLLVPVRHSSEVKLFLISSSGIAYMGSQWLSQFANKEESRWAMLGHSFSPDGRYWARYNTNRGLYLYHFDRCSGMLSDLMMVSFQVIDEFGGGGVLFSMNSRFVYFTHQRLLYRVDVEQSPGRLDTIYEITGGTGGTFHRMFAGPDGDILISPMARAAHWHVIDNADEIDPVKVAMKLRGRVLPCYTARSVPHVVNLQLGVLEGSDCDTLSVALDQSGDFSGRLSFRVFPNPASNHIRLELLSPLVFKNSLHIQVTTMNGEVVFQGELPPWAYIYEISLVSFAAGQYVINITDFNTEISGTLQFMVY